MQSAAGRRTTAPWSACVALILACCAPHAAAGGEAAPVQPKNIDISLSARWPASPAAVEAAEFVSEEDSSLFGAAICNFRD